MNERERGCWVFARVPKPDQKRILETIVSELLGESRPRGVCSRVWKGCCVVWWWWWRQ
jgi:hypothetical protein